MAASSDGGRTFAPPGNIAEERGGDDRRWRLTATARSMPASGGGPAPSPSCPPTHRFRSSRSSTFAPPTRAEPPASPSTSTRKQDHLPPAGSGRRSEVEQPLPDLAQPRGEQHRYLFPGRSERLLPRLDRRRPHAERTQGSERRHEQGQPVRAGHLGGFERPGGCRLVRLPQQPYRLHGGQRAGRQTSGGCPTTSTRRRPTAAAPGPGTSR